MSKKIIITGATGLIGKNLTGELKRKGYSVTVFTRDVSSAEKALPDVDDFVEWHPVKQIALENKPEWVNKLNNSYAVINLAGSSILPNRWTEKHKKRIYDSRIYGTRLLVDAIKSVEKKPEVLINASAIGYYGYLPREEFTEDSEPGNDFLARVVDDWEKESAKVEEAGVRRVSLRTGIVLDRNGGTLPMLVLQFKLFTGGHIGNGKQWFPWIHIDDEINLITFALENSQIEGPLNAVAPEDINMKDFCKILGNVMHRPSIFSVPKFVLKILFGEGADVFAGGTIVKPQKALKNRFVFKFENVERALKDLLRK